MQAYLFVHFTGEEKDGEQIYFSVSRDGLNWKDLNDGQLILRSRIGTKGVRDPYPVRHPRTGKFYLIATDLRIEAGYGWDAAQYEGSRDLIVWESSDLVHWSGERACTVGIEGAGCVWAPEAIYDEEKEAFLVFWASMVKVPRDAEPKQRIYAAYTNDFQTYSEAFLYIEREQHVIDTTIIRARGVYYRISKDETNKCLILEKSPSLTGTFTQIPSVFLEQLVGVEGPECYPMPDGTSWCLIADQFASGKGYLPLITDDLESGEFRVPKREEYDLGKTKKRHGGVLLISEEEYERLEKAF
ncbi:MAG: glycoside hydrolase family 43 protein [Fusicatenibacter sp.]|nr:glycoside hydrolase family 43 protein [Fusicatenibacter sp.]